MASLLEKFSGCIIGKCVGDALGFLVEGYSHDYCEVYVNEFLEKLEIPDFKRASFTFGQYSDDSQLSRELMISIVEEEGFLPEKYAKKIATMFKEEKMVGCGHATSNAAFRLIEGISWNEAGEPGPYAGNGTAMRVAPLGLYYYKEPDQLEKHAINQSIITHKDERCSAGSLAVVLTISYVITHEDIDDHDLVDLLITKINPISQLFAKEFQNLKQWLELPFEEAVDLIAKSGEPLEDDFWDKISPYVIPTVLISLYSFLKNKNSYINAISSAISVGGDVDTTAAITGAISGSYLGIRAIPNIYSSKINDQGEWGYSELVKLAERMYNQVKENY